MHLNCFSSKVFNPFKVNSLFINAISLIGLCTNISEFPTKFKKSSKFFLSSSINPSGKFSYVSFVFPWNSVPLISVLGFIYAWNFFPVNESLNISQAANSSNWSSFSSKPVNSQSNAIYLPQRDGN